MKKNGKFIGYIYSITCSVNKKQYIGQTTETIRRRFKRHYYDSKKTNFKFQRAIRKYGIENFFIKELEEIIKDSEIELIDSLNKKEMFYIMEKDTFKNGYNSTIGGEGASGRKQSEKHKKISKFYFEKMLEDQRKQVIVYDLNGKELAKCKSITEAYEITGIARSTIKKCCEEKTIYRKEYLFKYNDESEFVLDDYEIGVHHSNKKIAMYDLDGCFIKIYKSIADASREKNINHIMIIRNCKNETQKAGDYIFKYLKQDGSYKEKIEPFNKLLYKNHSPIVCYTKDNKFFKTYKTIKEASNDLGLFSESISMVCSKGKGSVHGFKFRYFTEKERESGEVNKNDYKSVSSKIN